MKVLINGIGNLGTTLANLLIKYKTDLGISEVNLLKNTINPWQHEDLAKLEMIGCRIYSNAGDHYPSVSEILGDVDYVFDTTNNGGGRRNKPWYEQFPNLRGACAQGSEKGFGISHMIGVNDEMIRNQKFVHLVSCNTHSIAAITNWICEGNIDLINTVDFVIVRRSEDIGNHERLVSANVVARHLDPILGTHHSIDVLDLYRTIGKSFKVTSSDITTPSQLMHGVRFNIELKEEIDQDELEIRLQNAPFLSSSVKFDSNVIFEAGRRYSFHGRIYSHAIVIKNNLMVEGKSVKGWAFIPQEGNTLLSTLNAFLYQTDHPKKEEVIRTITDDLVYCMW